VAQGAIKAATTQQASKNADESNAVTAFGKAIAEIKICAEAYEVRI
jgi:hypothetical protein